MNPDHTTTHTGWRLDLETRLFALIPALFSLLLYLPSLFHDFVWDAQVVFLDDPTIREWKYFFSGFAEALFRNIPPEGGRLENLQYYRPLVKMLHVLEYQAFGANPLGYNAVNIVLNSAVAGLFHLLVLAVSGNGLVALLAALLYAANPSRVEAVCWSYSDSYILAAAFSLAAMLAWRGRRRLWALVCYVLSLLSHEMAILLPLALVGHDVLVGERPRRGEHAWAAWFLFAAAIFLTVRTRVVGAVPLSGVPLATFCNTGVVVFKRYLKLFWWPDAAVTIYPSELFPAFTAEVALSYAVLAGVAALAVFLWMRFREGLFWLVWFFLWPVVSLNAGRFGAYLMAEKIIYLAAGGLCALLAGGLLRAGLPRRPAVVLLAGLICLHAAVTFSRLGAWQNTRTYLEQALEHAPRFPSARYTLGLVYAEAGEYDKALAEFQKAVEADPGFSLAYNNLGNTWLLRGDEEKALAAWHAAVTADPANPMPYYNLGMTMLMRKEPRQALGYLEGYLARAREPDPRAVEQVRRLRAMPAPPPDGAAR